MNETGKTLILAGISVLIAGIIFSFFGKIPFIDRLPEDFLLKGDGLIIFFPLVTSIILSIILSLILRFLHK